MAYISNNKKKEIKRVLDIYKSVKEYDKPDTFIVKNTFPKHGIFISYSTLMNYKNLKPSDLLTDNTPLYKQK
jgi:hypothetical protein